MITDLKQLVQKYLKDGRLLQIATVSNDQPWSCTVYYVADVDFNLYWISKPDTRHSNEIHRNAKVAASIPIKFDTLTVVGLQLDGHAELVEDEDEIKKAVKFYSEKFQRGKDWYEDFIAGKNEHRLYRIKPRSFVIFDRVNFPDDSRQEYILT